MTRYRNQLRHAIVLPGGAPLAARGEVDLDDESAAPLVADGVLAPASETTKSARKKESAA